MLQIAIQHKYSFQDFWRRYANHTEWYEIYKPSFNDERCKNITQERNSRTEVSIRGLLKIFVKLKGEYSCVGISFLLKLQASGLELCQKRQSDRDRCYPVNFVKSSRIVVAASDNNQKMSENLKT